MLSYNLTFDEPLTHRPHVYRILLDKADNQ